MQKYSHCINRYIHKTATSLFTKQFMSMECTQMVQKCIQMVLTRIPMVYEWAAQLNTLVAMLRNPKSEDKYIKRKYKRKYRRL